MYRKAGGSNEHAKAIRRIEKGEEAKANENGKDSKKELAPFTGNKFVGSLGVAPTEEREDESMQGGAAQSTAKFSRRIGHPSGDAETVDTSTAPPQPPTAFDDTMCPPNLCFENQ